ncbi:A1S_2505 family phage non-structural protein [Variovorax sp. LjRoot178]|uniref:A1S_2505 family phage non-structural protein n=1 Tax=Variovorax sp. LjRoot178 TaxID=3342277 RepID=UPI003ECD9D10
MAAVFVFGSNTAGRHGKGAALFARQSRGAIYGQGEGLQGNSYAIPTKGQRPDRSLYTLPLEQIRAGVDRFLAFAVSRPDLQFEVSPIGCGLAGYKPEEIAPMFLGAPANCQPAVEFSPV